jgi:hypothetical protein
MEASFSGDGVFRGAEPGGDDELAAVEIEIGGPAAVFPAGGHEQEAAQGEIGEGVFAGREEAFDAGGQGHEALLFAGLSSHVLAITWHHQDAPWSREKILGPLRKGLAVRVFA